MTAAVGLIDLRSDTVTRPSPEMRGAIAAAPVGDDQFGEDPTVNLLRERVATLLGKDAALWLPTGTMANQVALRVLTNPGDDVIVTRESHAVWHETGASAANAGVQFTEIGSRGVFTAADFLAARKPRGHIIYPPTTLVEIENTHNRAGGVVFPQDEAERASAPRRATMASPRISTAPVSGTPPWPYAARRPTWPPRLPSCPSPSRKASGRPEAQFSAVPACSSIARSGTGACWAGRCVRWGSLPPRECTP